MLFQPSDIHENGFHMGKEICFCDFFFFFFDMKTMPSTYSVISTSQANSAKEPDEESRTAYKMKRQVTHSNR